MKPREDRGSERNIRANNFIFQRWSNFPDTYSSYFLLDPRTVVTLARTWPRRHHNTRRQIGSDIVSCPFFRLSGGRDVSERTDSWLDGSNYRK